MKTDYTKNMIFKYFDNKGKSSSFLQCEILIQTFHNTLNEYCGCSLGREVINSHVQSFNTPITVTS